MFPIQPDEFGTSQRAGEAEEKQYPVAGACEFPPAGPALADLGRGDGCCSPRRTAMLASDAAQRLTDCRMLGIDGMASNATSMGNGGNSPALTAVLARPSKGAGGGGDGLAVRLGLQLVVGCLTGDLPADSIYFCFPSTRMQNEFGIAIRLHASLEYKITRRAERGSFEPWRHWAIAWISCILPIHHLGHSPHRVQYLLPGDDPMMQPVGDMLAGDAERCPILHQGYVVDVRHLGTANTLIDPAHDIA